MPRAHDVHFIMVEAHALIGFIFGDNFLDLGHHKAFAGRAALMRAQILVSLPLSMDVIDANFTLPVGDNFLIAFFEIGNFTDKNILRHFY
jgi:hypothetical protein